MKTKTLIIIGMSVIIFLLVAVVYPTINYKTWGNNELHYATFSVGTKIVCDEWLWQPPQNCRHVSIGTDTNRESEIQDVEPQESSMSSVSIDSPSGMSQNEREQLQIKKVLDQCNNESKVQISILYKFSNLTHYIDGHVCEWQKDSVLIDILDRCKQIKETGSFDGFAYGSSWQNETHSIDNSSCKWEIIK
jgi:hypothetical protein